MKSTATRLSLILLAAFLAQSPASAADKKAKEAAAGAAVATVNGVAIPESRAELLLSQQASQGVPDSPQLREQVKEELIRREVLAQAAKAKGLEKSPAFLNQVEFARQAILISAYLQDYAKAHPVSDAAVKAEYDKAVAARGTKEYKARHILVDKEEDAKEIIAKLGKGEKFETLASQSKDPGSKDKGGELEWSAPGAYVKEFGEALATLNIGSYTTTPVKTQFGYHVIKLEDTRDLKNPSFDEVKPRILQGLQQQAVEQHLVELRAKAKVK